MLHFQTFPVFREHIHNSQLFVEYYLPDLKTIVKFQAQNEQKQHRLSINLHFPLYHNRRPVLHP